MVRYCEDAHLIPNDSVDNAEREAPRDETTFPMTPHRTEAWVPQKQPNGALKLREEGLR